MFPVKNLARWAEATALAGLLAALACGGRHNDPPPPVATAVAPAFTAQPQATTVVAGQPASFSVTATGSAPLSYQWRKDGTAIAGATAATCTIASAQASDAGAYTVVVGNPAGSATSAPAVLAVNVPPAFNVQPPPAQTVAAGGTATFSAAATGNGTLSYQWTKAGANLVDGGGVSGATTATLTLSGIQGSDAAAYACVATNTLNGTTTRTTSGASVLTVTVPAATHLVLSGFPATTAGVAQAFTVAALDATNHPVPGYTGTVRFTSTDGAAVLPAAYTFTAADGGTHTFSATLNTAGSQTLTATDTASAALSGSQSGILVQAAAAASLTLAGFPASTPSGTAQTVTVTARDTFGNLSTGYAGTVHFTSTDATALLPADYTFTAGDGGTRTFSVTLNGAGTQSITVADTVLSSLTGSQSGIDVLALAPTILTQPQTQTVLPPDPVTFTVAAKAHGGGALTYTWMKNGTAIAGATEASYTVASTEFATNTDAYSVRVTEGSLSTDSATVYALASVPSPTYAGDPVPVPSRPLTVLPSLHVDAVAFPNGAFRLGYDESLKDPVWSAYVNFPVKSPYANSTADYTADLRLAAPQVGKNDYTGIYTGGASYPDSYDRGHMVPRADVSYRYTPVAGDDATIMSNLVPQISQLNQQTWQKLEDAIGGTQGGSTSGLTSFKGRVWVYTGSVFPAAPAWWNSTVTPGLRIAIPEGCYKIVVHETSPGHPEVLAMLMPNAWGLTNSTSTLTWYVTSVARIEALTGLDFFPNLAAVAPGLDIAAWKAKVDVRGWRTPFEQATGPNVHMIQPSYDITVDQGATVAFEGAATPNSAAGTGATVPGATWTFGDGTPSASGFSTSHTFTAGGTFNVAFTADDGLGSSNTITRVVRVVPPASSNTAPTTMPATLADQTAAVGQAVTVTFTVADDRTPAGSVQVAATSDNAALLPASGIVVTNASGAVSLVLTPAAGQTGAAGITVTLTDGDGAVATRTFQLTVSGAVSTVLSEGFESGTKTAYATGTVAFPSGPWILNDALVGTSTSDRKTGLQSLRVRNGLVTMGFDWPSGAQTVTVNHGKYGTDADSTWELWYSTDSGSTWTVAGPSVTSSSTTLTQAVFTLNVPGPVRFEFRKLGGTTTRFNLDDFQINGY